MSDTLPQAVVRRLAPEDSLAAFFGSDAAYDIWLFQWKIRAQVEGSGSAAAVFSTLGGWAAPAPAHTLHHPRLRLAVIADVSRDDAGQPAADDAEDRALAGSAAIDQLLNFKDGVQTWGDLRVLSCHRLDEPFVESVPEGDGVLRAISHYGVTLG